MPSFADLKAKATSVTNAGAEKFQHVRDRNTSVPMAKTTWDPYSGEPPPPPPPSRSLVNRNTKPLAPLLPPPSRTSSAASRSLSNSSVASSASPAPPLPSRGPSSGPPPTPPRGKPAAPVPPALPVIRSSPQLNPPPIINSPPPIVRSTRPDFNSRTVIPKPASTSRKTEIDWSNLSPEDKDIFFSWLDEFFANFTPPSAVRDTAVVQDPPITTTPSHAPPLRSSTKPASWNRAPVGNQYAFTLSYPPHTKHGSAALDLTHYFAPSTPWTEAWYSGEMPWPPPLVDSGHALPTLSMMTRGTQMTVSIGAIFSDLSLFWGTVEFSTSNPSDMRQVKRDAVYLPRPKALGRQELVEAHELYGETIALYAESFLGTGQPCARGECWDLANEALKYFAQYDYIPKPVQSTARTHGHLIYEGKASNQGKEMVGRWRGGDDRIRRGDIAEWREVKIGLKGQPPSSFYSLGFPDHTAVIVSDSIPLPSAKDGGSLMPSDLGTIAVVEQSQGRPPSRTEYDLSYFREGEMWIYRPIGMKTYLGLDELAIAPPDGVQALLQRL
ncbi:hypothetical protein BYT27DRAFT_7183362 [Phlegmacium glaucopus]|nr:hypothetical protein BYT27DRAFT_7183362 [Phlegmacium glaucopus]